MPGCMVSGKNAHMLKTRGQQFEHDFTLKGSYIESDIAFVTSRDHLIKSRCI